jgi:O-antigen/teichoic acid export membrane protein
LNAHSAITTLVARIAAMVGPIGVSIITARALGAEGRGLYFLVITYAQIAAQFGNMGLHSSNTYLTAAYPERRSAVLTNSIVVSLLGGVLATTPVIAWFGLADERSWTAIRYTYLLAPLLILFLLISNIAVAIGRVPLFNLLTILYGVFALLFAGIAALFNAGAEQFLWAAIISLLVASVIGIMALLPHCNWRLKLDWRLFRQGLGYATRAYLATLAGFLMNRVGVIVLQWEGKLDDVGHFSIAQQIADALILLPSTVGLLLMPNLLRMMNSTERASTMWRTAFILSGIMFVILAFIGVLTPIFLPLVFGSEYNSAVPLVLAFLPSVLVMSFIIAVSQFLSAEGFPIAQVVTWLVATAVHIVLSTWLLAIIGALAIPVSYGIVSLFILGSLSVLAHRLTKRLKAAEVQLS